MGMLTPGQDRTQHHRKVWLKSLNLGWRHGSGSCFLCIRPSTIENKILKCQSLFRYGFSQYDHNIKNHQKTRPLSSLAVISNTALKSHCAWAPGGLKGEGERVELLICINSKTSSVMRSYTHRRVLACGHLSSVPNAGRSTVCCHLTDWPHTQEVC